MTQSDPLLYELPLPLGSTLFPFGCGLELSTNSAEVNATATVLWGRYAKRFNGAAMRLRVAVSGERAEVAPRPAVPQGYGHLIMTSQGAGNFAVCDLAQSLACVSLTRDVAEDRGWVTQHFLEPMVCFMAAARQFAIVHAACVALSGRAVLLCGGSGSGKTCLAWVCARKGWTFLSGDATQLIRDSPDPGVVGRPFSIRFRESARDVFPDLRSHVPARGPGGKMDIELDPEGMGAAVSQSAVASHVVLLDRSARTKAGVERVAPEEMFQYFDQAVFYGPEWLRREQRNTFRRFVRLPLFRLRYADADDAENLLRSMVLGDGAC